MRIASSLKIYISAGVILFATCKKKTDERDAVVGSYSGIRIFTQLNGGAPPTMIIGPDVLNLKKGEADSVVIIEGSGLGGSCAYKNGVFRPFGCYHCPSLTKDGDSLFVHLKDGLGPYWTDWRMKKN